MRIRGDSLEIVVFVVQPLNCVQLLVTPWTGVCQASLSFTVSVCSNSCSLSQWCHPTLILCHPLYLLSSIFLGIRVFSNESVFASGSQSIGASTSASVLPMNIQDWFLLGWTDWISLQSKGLSRVFSNSLKKLQIELSYTQQSHCWAYTPWKQELIETHVPQCWSQHCL